MNTQEKRDIIIDELIELFIDLNKGQSIKLADFIIEREKALQNELDEAREALKEIAKGEGAYDMDQLKHASNTIDNMKSIALSIFKKQG